MSPPRTSGIALALSGGGARAIAFHLGCLRALHDRDVLAKVQTLSGVSGGAVIGALYAYHDESFESFDARVVELLRTGLQRSMFEALFSTVGLRAFVTNCIARPAALFAAARGLPPPFRRWASRTDTLETVLAQDKYFGDRLISEVRREGLEVILNACELRTGTAFRYGSKVSGSWRLGALDPNQATVAHAVASSAAFPLLLPAFDRDESFRRPGQEHKREYRTIVTDGGVFDNLGITALKPDSAREKSLYRIEADCIIACSAGYGAFDDRRISFGMLSRIERVTDVTFKKNQDGLIHRLHTWTESGLLRGMVFAYLGQDDDLLPRGRPDLIRRDEVCDYPTNFAAMSAENLRKLTLRGEQLTRLHIARHCPWL